MSIYTLVPEQTFDFINLEKRPRSEIPLSYAIT